MEILETACIYFSWDEGIKEEELKELGEWLSRFVNGKITVKKEENEDSYSLLFIREEE